MVAIDKAVSDVRNKRVQPVPNHLRDAHSKAGKYFGHGEGYIYPHNHEHHHVDQDYLTVPATYYEPAGHGYEAKIKERLAFWKSRRAQTDQEDHDEAE